MPDPERPILEPARLVHDPERQPPDLQHPALDLERRVPDLRLDLDTRSVRIGLLEIASA